MAKEIQSFEKYGLHSELVYLPSGPVAVSALLAGDLTMAFAATNAAIASIHRGAPLLAVGAITRSPGWSLWVQPEIAKPEQLQGRILGITRAGSATHFMTLTVLQRLGLQDSVKLQPFGGAPEANAAFRAGRIAGRVTSLKPVPQARSLLDLADLGIVFSIDLLVVGETFT